MNVKYLDMPGTVRGFSHKVTEPDGDYVTIVLNSRLCRSAQEKAYRHEMSHIECDDFLSECADNIEGERHD